MIQEIIEYRRYVKFLADNNENRIFLNSDNEKAIVVFTELFAIAHSEVKIFAGCLSNDVSNNGEYLSSINNFISKGGHLKILLNAFNEEKAKESDLLKRLAFYQTKNLPVQVRLCNDKPYFDNDPEEKEVHFTVVDSHAYRIETDIIARKSICNMNDNIMGHKLSDLFDSIFTRSVDLDLISIYKMNRDAD